MTIPKDIRRIKHIEVGDEVLFVLEGNRVDFFKMSEESIESYAGLWAKSKEDAVSEVKKIRKDSDMRLKRLGL